MTSNSYPRLSKSRFMAGLQCLKRLYLECHHRDLADEVGPVQQAIFDSGIAVGELARQRFPGGRLVQEKYFEQREAERTTRRLLEDGSIPAMYEPAFTFEGIQTRVDILRRTEDGKFDLIEVKSNTSLKDVHIPDVAIQLHVIEGCGVPIRRTFLMRIDRSYVYRGGKHHLEELFALEDVTNRARAYIEHAAPGKLARMWQSLRVTQTLDIETGRHCTTPYRCPFYGHCHRDEPEHPVSDLPSLSRPLEKRLRNKGITDIRSIPPDFMGLTSMQRRMIPSVVTGQPYAGPKLASELARIEAPASFLDFETLSPAVPRYTGTRPYQAIPFQWSLHVRAADGELTHSSFLDDGLDDPRERFITSLLKAVPPEGSVVAYSGYEGTVLRNLAEAFPSHCARLLELRERIVDLLQLIRGNYYHPGFHGSLSIKAVAPALVPDLLYEDLEIQEGTSAGAYFARLADGDVVESERTRIRKALSAYCERDTEAMVRVYEALKAVSAT